MRKIITILGARPQFIKASVVSHCIKKNTQLKEIVVHTGQHFDANMSNVFFAELGMDNPKYQLNIHGGLHGEMTGRMLNEIEKVLLVEKPDAVLVYGDTNSTLAGALASIKMHIPVAHVESGLRSFNMAMPEEINRILTDRVSRWLFVPTNVALQHLTREGFASEQIIVVGDVMYDVALYHGSRVSAEGRQLERHGLRPKKYVLATVHRAENTDCPIRLQNIFNALLKLSSILTVIVPLHPRTKKILESSELYESIIKSNSLILTDPVGYLDMVQLEKYATLIATDSGGVQKEAFFYRVPCVTLRDETEWVELVEAGWNRLAPPVDTDTLLSAFYESIGSSGKEIRPYGDGNAASLIVDYLIRDFV